MKNKIKFIILILFGLLINCTEKEPEIVENMFLKDIPQISVFDATNITKNSAKVIAQIVSNNENILSYGFCWSKYDTVPTINDSKIELDLKENITNFEYDLQNLDSSSIYFTRAFAQNEKDISYSKTIKVETLPYVGEVVFYLSSNVGSYVVISGTDNTGKSYSGTITKYLTSGTPECGRDGCVTFSMPEGDYEFWANSSFSYTFVQFTVIKNQCTKVWVLL